MAERSEAKELKQSSRSFCSCCGEVAESEGVVGARGRSETGAEAEAESGAVFAEVAVVGAEEIERWKVVGGERKLE